MSEYVKDSISKSEHSDATAKDILIKSEQRSYEAGKSQLIHGEWLHDARKELKSNMFATPAFALLLIFILLFVGSTYLFEQLPVFTGILYAVKVVITTLFAVSLGFILVPLAVVAGWVR